jgi:hypothetical protein
MMLGTSGKSLAARLGLARGVAGTALGAPREVLEAVRAEAPEANIEYKPLAGVYQLRPSLFLWCFCSLDAELKRALPALRRNLQDAGALWISWPRKNSWSALRIDADSAVTEEAIRAYARPLGLVDAAACAVDENWSAMKLVLNSEAKDA